MHIFRSRSNHMVFTLSFLLLFCFTLSGCGLWKDSIDTHRTAAPAKKKRKVATQKPYTVRGKTYYPTGNAQNFSEEGRASWYGGKFHGRKTANGEVYNMYKMTGAHKILPMNTMVRVTNLDNGKSTKVRINDRGPFVRGRVIDVSKAAAQELDMIRSGTARVRVETLDVVPGYTPDGDMPGVFFVQVGSFTVKGNAENMLSTMRRRYEKSRLKAALIGGKRFWRVQAGAFATLHAAEKAQKKLERTYPSCFVIAD